MLLHFDTHFIPDRSVSYWLVQMLVLGLAIALALVVIAVPVI